MADTNAEAPAVPKFQGGSDDPSPEATESVSAADRVKEASENAAARAREAAAKASEAAEPAVKAVKEASEAAAAKAQEAAAAASQAAEPAIKAVNEAGDKAAENFRQYASAAEVAAAPAAEAAHRAVKDAEAKAQEAFDAASAAAEPHIKAAAEAAEAASIRAKEAAARAAEAAEPTIKAAQEAAEAAKVKAAEMTEKVSVATKEASEAASAKAAEIGKGAVQKAGEIAEATKKGLSHAGEQVSKWEDYAELYVPSGSFGDDPKAQQTLRFSRQVLFGLYGIVGFLLFASVMNFLIGCFEIGESTVYVGELEAPSFAVCPWNAADAVVNNPKSTYEMYAVKYTQSGRIRLPFSSETCEYDRKCSCLDLREVVLKDKDLPHTGNEGLPSKDEVNFREHIVVHTTLKDPSLTQTLKVGLYNSQDSRPSWIYAPQFRTTIGSLRLESLKFTVMPWSRLWGFLTGYRPRDWAHHYAFTGNVVDTSSERDMDVQQFTRISMEFENFYVKQTNVTAMSTSMYGIVIILLLVLALCNVFSVWETMFPMERSGTRGVAMGMKFFSLQVLGKDLDAEDVTDPEKPIVADSDEAVKGKTYGTA
eukprot:TRINITY_DN4264_c0_g1_i2.p1 TRINITY_DN4264_c0_g1~~TRINITY_DN4264_c0_g1_i2.p1  ORF type:complete len:593 (-),score=198.67 TRINITY_DN4264_c0_g1_i2:86-1864(-)